MRIRDFLVDSYQAFGKPLNWRLERWNYARYFIAPFLGAYEVKYDSVYVIQELPEPKLPDGFIIQSMAQENNLELRRKAFGLGFNHPDPREWPSYFSCQELQKAPDYRKDLDLYIVGPDGKYVSFCLVWYDEQNRMGILEPAGTIPEFRRMGLGREVVMEGIRRAAALGAEQIIVGSGQEFYEALGFEKKYVSYAWTKTF